MKRLALDGIIAAVSLAAGVVIGLNLVYWQKPAAPVDREYGRPEFV